MQDSIKAHGIILFDGICNFCNRTIDFISRKDRGDYFRFASLQSAAGKALLEKFQIPASYRESVVFIEGDKAWRQSDAFCHIMKHLPGIWKAGYACIIIPAALRDGLYGLVARHRYRWFGRRDTCRVPTPEEKQKFLD